LISCVRPSGFRNALVASCNRRSIGDAAGFWAESAGRAHRTWTASSTEALGTLVFPNPGLPTLGLRHVVLERRRSGPRSRPSVGSWPCRPRALPCQPCVRRCPSSSRTRAQPSPFAGRSSTPCRHRRGDDRRRSGCLRAPCRSEPIQEGRIECLRQGLARTTPWVKSATPAASTCLSRYSRQRHFRAPERGSLPRSPPGRTAILVLCAPKKFQGGGSLPTSEQLVDLGAEPTRPPAAARGRVIVGAESGAREKTLNHRSPTAVNALRLLKPLRPMSFQPAVPFICPRPAATSPSDFSVRRKYCR